MMLMIGRVIYSVIAEPLMALYNDKIIILVQLVTYILHYNYYYYYLKSICLIVTVGISFKGDTLWLNFSVPISGQRASPVAYHTRIHVLICTVTFARYTPVIKTCDIQVVPCSKFVSNI